MFLVPMPPMITVPSAAAGAVLSPQPNMVQRFHRRSSTNEPRLMVSTDGVADIPVQGNLDYTNHFGIAVVPLISSYQPSTVAVNMNDLPDGVTVAEKRYQRNVD
ncbi:fimbria/pilus outer membrane usher protein [Escherichia coli]